MGHPISALAFEPGMRPGERRKPGSLPDTGELASVSSSCGKRLPEKAALAPILLTLVAALATSSCRRLPPTYREPATGMQFKLVEPGHFEMGFPAGEPGRRIDEPAH